VVDGYRMSSRMTVFAQGESEALVVSSRRARSIRALYVAYTLARTPASTFLKKPNAAQPQAAIRRHFALSGLLAQTEEPSSNLAVQGVGEAGSWSSRTPRDRELQFVRAESKEAGQSFENWPGRAPR